jgi:hypothetical protein
MLPMSFGTHSDRMTFFLKDGSAVIFAALFAALLFSFAIGFVVGWACKESDWK